MGLIDINAIASLQLAEVAYSKRKIFHPYHFFRHSIHQVLEFNSQY